VRKRPIAVTLLVAMMPQLVGCTVRTTRHVAPAQLRPVELGEPAGGRYRTVAPDHLREVTTTQGTEVMFDRNYPVNFTRDTLAARVQGAWYRVALGDVREMTVVRPSVLASIGASVGVTALVLGGVVGLLYLLVPTHWTIGGSLFPPGNP
jgi:hypothetical protein